MLELFDLLEKLVYFLHVSEELLGVPLLVCERA
jgi:hypothetical protein